MRINLALQLEAVAGVNAAAKQHLERAGKCGLVNGGGGGEPVVNVNIKPWPNVDGDWRIAKLAERVHLLREIRSLMGPTNDVPWIDPGRRFPERCGGYFGKRILVVVLIAPARFNKSAKFGKLVHRILAAVYDERGLTMKYQRRLREVIFCRDFDSEASLTLGLLHLIRV